MNSILEIEKKTFDLSYAMLGGIIELCPESLWNEVKGGFVFWQQLLHALTGVNYWMRDSAVAFVEPFPERKVYPELDHRPEGRLTKDELRKYKTKVDGIVERFYGRRDEAWLLEPSKLFAKINNLEIINMQIRHIQYHVGHCECVFRQEDVPTQEWLDYFGD